METLIPKTRTDSLRHTAISLIYGHQQSAITIACCRRFDRPYAATIFMSSTWTAGLFLA